MRTVLGPDSLLVEENVIPGEFFNRLIQRYPKQRSFKQALISIAFSSAYLEALLHIVGYRRLGPREYETIDKGTYRQKLASLGVKDVVLLDGSDRLRRSRKELLHEKAVKEALSKKVEIRNAQDEARFAVDFVRKVEDFIRKKEPPKNAD
ncbi:MAG: hypothetical protein WC986_08665 [Elusimicrobiota bacterium]|jgi:hypothetical protein